MALSCNNCDREAKFGMLCDHCFGRVQRALDGDGSDNPTFGLSWAAYVRVVKEHGGRLMTAEVEGKPRGFESGFLIAPAILQLDALDCLLELLPIAGGDAKRWVSVVEGAADAMQFANRSHAFRRRHELAEPDRRLKPARWRCPNEHCQTINPNPELLVVQPRPNGDGATERMVQCAFCAHTLSMTDALRLAAEEEWRHEKVS